jgi:glycosyltransferase involved in cell wall biosynthesis
MTPDVAIVMGTYNRLELLKKAIASVRRSVGILSHRIIVVDGGSTDGTVAWLAEQPDVSPIFQELPLKGAVDAYNLGFTFAVYSEAPYICIVNDDDSFVGSACEIETAVSMMAHDARIGAVAFEADLRGKWQTEDWQGRPSCGKGVVRREALMSVARAQGDQEGCQFWSTQWHTYAADSAAGCWMWKLGWQIVRGLGLHVHDGAADNSDAMREANVAAYHKSGTAKLFTDAWGDPASLNYDRAMAERFGGRIL